MPGPAPKRNSERRRRNAPRANTVLLPKEGRAGPPPKWPLEGRAPRRWAELWALPQAVMWEKQGLYHLVARYVVLEAKINDPEDGISGNASFWGVLAKIEDNLGLNSMALMRLQWEVSGTAGSGDDAPERAEGQATIINLQERAGFAPSS